MLTWYYLDFLDRAWCQVCVEEDSELQFNLLSEDPGKPPKIPDADSFVRVVRFPQAYPSCTFCQHPVDHRCQHASLEETWECHEIQRD